MTSQSNATHTFSSRLNSLVCAMLALGCFGLLLFACQKALHDLYGAWQTDEYSHGIIIPFVALLIGWHRLTDNRPAIKPSWLGIPLLALSALLLAIGVLAAFQTATQYGLIISIIGLSLAFLGENATLTLAPAFIYLFFAVPLPNIVYATLSQHLQLISSSIGVWILDVVYIPVFQEGNVIDLGGYKLQVVEACSGLRYLFPLVSFGYLIAYLLEDSLWKRVVVFLSTILITIGMNSLRIAIIGITVNFWGQTMAEGFIHEFEGWVVFAVCILLLMMEVRLLIGIGHRGRFRFEVFGIARGAIGTGKLSVSGPAIFALLGCALLAYEFGLGIIDKRPEVIPNHKSFTNFPLQFDLWHGQQHSLDAEILKGLQLTDYWLADYHNDKDEAPVNFYIAYYESQRVGASTHSPSSCIPGGGWQIVSKSEKQITLLNDASLVVSRLLIKRNGVAQLVYYWFDERGRNITETTYAKWYMLIDSISMHRTDGALVRLTTQISEKETETDAEVRLNDFLSLAYPSIRSYIPGRTLAPSGEGS